MSNHFKNKLRKKKIETQYKPKDCKIKFHKNSIKYFIINFFTEKTTDIVSSLSQKVLSHIKKRIEVNIKQWS